MSTKISKYTDAWEKLKTTGKVEYTVALAIEHTVRRGIIKAKALDPDKSESMKHSQIRQHERTVSNDKVHIKLELIKVIKTRNLI